MGWEIEWSKRVGRLDNFYKLDIPDKYKNNENHTQYLELLYWGIDADIKIVEDIKKLDYEDKRYKKRPNNDH